MLNHVFRLSHSPVDLANLKDVQTRIMGDPTKIKAGKPRIDQDTGEHIGGVEFERDDSAISVQPNNRAYPVSTSIQLARNMDAPQRGRKTGGLGLSEKARLVKDILKVGEYPLFGEVMV
jgi:hypothetical protein